MTSKPITSESEARARAKRLAAEDGHAYVVWQIGGGIAYEVHVEGKPPATSLRVPVTVIYPEDES